MIRNEISWTKSQGEGITQMSVIFIPPVLGIMRRKGVVYKVMNLKSENIASKPGPNTQQLINIGEMTSPH